MRLDWTALVELGSVHWKTEAIMHHGSGKTAQRAVLEETEAAGRFGDCSAESRGGARWGQARGRHI